MSTAWMRRTWIERRVGARPTVAALAIAFLAGAAAPQEAVPIEVRVVDRDGSAVAGLRGGDFQVSVDGKKAKVLAHREMPGRAPTMVAVYLDQVGLDKESRDAVLRDIESTLLDGASVVPTTVASFDGSFRVLLPATTDAGAIRGALQGLREPEPVVPGSTLQRSALQETLRQNLDLMRRSETMARAAMESVIGPAKTYASTVSAEARNAMQALAAFLGGLAVEPGHKVAVVVSEGRVMRPLDQMVATLNKAVSRRTTGGSIATVNEGADASTSTDVFQGNADALGEGARENLASDANRSLVELQQELAAFDASVWFERTAAMANGAQTRLLLVRPSGELTSPGGDRRNRDAERELRISDELEGPAFLATATGGAEVDAGALAGALQQRVGGTVGQSYEVDLPGALLSDGQPHQIEIKVKQRGAEALYPSIYMQQTKLQQLADRTLAASTLGWEENSHELTADVEGQTPEGSHVNVDLILSFPIAAVELVEREGAHQATLHLAVVAVSGSGEISPPRLLEAPLVVPADQVEAAREQLYGARAQLQLEPGSYRIGVGLWDGESESGSFITREVEVGG